MFASLSLSPGPSEILEHSSDMEPLTCVLPWSHVDLSLDAVLSVHPVVVPLSVLLLPRFCLSLSSLCLALTGDVSVLSV